MDIPIRAVAEAARPLVVGLALVLVAVGGASASEGYFMQAKVTRTNPDGTLDFWVTSVHEMPRREPAETERDPAELPKAIATLEFKSTGAAAGRRDAGAAGSRISLRGRCEDLGRATRVAVIQVRLRPGQPWQQASLAPENRTGYAGFKQVAAEVCPPDAGGDDPASADP